MPARRSLGIGIGTGGGEFHRASAILILIPSRRVVRLPTSRVANARNQAYFNELLIEVNLVFSWGPMPCTVAIIANAIPQAIKQYSIAVAAESSARNALAVFMFSLYRRPFKLG